jgi:DNA-binding MarR family transcriptional regulator
MKDSTVAEMRAFNRFYTALVGVLNRKFLNGKLSLPETRVLHAINSAEGITANDIVPLLHIDKSYLSKILIRFGKMKFVSKKVSSTDGRAYHLYLTPIGKKELDFYNHLSDEFVKQILVQLPEKDREELINCMRQITGILQRVKL